MCVCVCVGGGGGGYGSPGPPLFAAPGLSCLFCINQLTPVNCLNQNMVMIGQLYQIFECILQDILSSDNAI